MNTQINIRMPETLLDSAKSYAAEHGFGTVQEFIKETVREKLFDEPDMTREELLLIRKLAEATENKNLYGTEEELFNKLKKKAR